MLTTLHINDYALIEALEVDFENGLNILTGETGAGKSIILGALKMILGERARAGVIRRGARKAIIEGFFDSVTMPAVQELLEGNELEPSTHLILRREIAPRYSRAYINDSPVRLPIVRAIASHLIDLHGQHEHQSLLRKDTHIELLDHYGGLGALRADYTRHYKKVDSLLKKRAKMERQQQQTHMLRERLIYEIEDIDAVGPELKEEEELEEEQRRLENAEHLFNATGELFEMLYAQENSTGDQLVVARNAIQALARIDSVFESASEEIRSAQIIVADIASQLQDYNVRIEFNPDRLERIRDRLGALDHLKRKYGGTLEAVIEYREKIGAQHDRIVNYKESMRALEEELEGHQKALSGSARRLSTKRHEVATSIENTVAAELGKLGMPQARMEVSIGWKSDDKGWIRLPVPAKSDQRYRAFQHGMDQVEFKIRTNQGEATKSLQRIASGGEISRIMLALKTVLAKSESLPILVFDEIDNGVSGRIARKVGKSMAALGRYHQIIAITHLPQIASLGQAHFTVEKRVDGGRTRSYIRRLDDEERAEHVARLFSGAEVTDAMRASARELIVSC